MPRTVPQGGRLRGRRLGPYTGCRMPELPDVTVYLEALDATHPGRPPRAACAWPTRSCCARSTRRPPRSPGATVTGLRRLGKRIVIELEGDCFVVIHLMIAGPLALEGGRREAARQARARPRSTSRPAPLTLTEAGTKRRAAIHLVRGEAALAAHDPGGLELFEADLAAFRAALTREIAHAQARRSPIRAS